MLSGRPVRVVLHIANRDRAVRVVSEGHFDRRHHLISPCTNSVEAVTTRYRSRGGGGVVARGDWRLALRGDATSAADELGAGPRAFDVEWSDRAGAALLQLATKEGAVILDVPRLCASREGCAALRRAFRGAPLLGFGCSQDLARLRATPAAAPWVDADQEVYDLQTALTQKRGGPGLAAAAKAYLGKAPDKSQQCSDWDARPLSEAQRAYAALDAVAVLLIHEKLRSVDDAIEKLRRIPPR